MNNMGVTCTDPLTCRFFWGAGGLFGFVIGQSYKCISLSFRYKNIVCNTENIQNTCPLTIHVVTKVSGTGGYE